MESTVIRDNGVLGPKPTQRSIELKMSTLNNRIRTALACFTAVVGFSIAGCDDKETLLDVETPDGGVEVERDVETGNVTVDVDE